MCIAAGKKANGGCNCLSPQAVLLPRGWAQVRAAQPPTALPALVCDPHIAGGLGSCPASVTARAPRPLLSPLSAGLRVPRRAREAAAHPAHPARLLPGEQGTASRDGGALRLARGLGRRRRAAAGRGGGRRRDAPGRVRRHGRPELRRRRADQRGLRRGPRPRRGAISPAILRTDPPAPPPGRAQSTVLGGARDEASRARCALRPVGGRRRRARRAARLPLGRRRAVRQLGCVRRPPGSCYSLLLPLATHCYTPSRLAAPPPQRTATLSFQVRRLPLVLALRARERRRGGGGEGGGGAALRLRRGERMVRPRLRGRMQGREARHPAGSNPTDCSHSRRVGPHSRAPRGPAGAAGARTPPAGRARAAA